jgi:hypothetical protein
MFQYTRKKRHTANTYLGIHHYGFIGSARRVSEFVENQQAQVDSHLWGCQADTIGVIHSVEHAPGKLDEVSIKSSDRGVPKTKL